MLAREPAQSYVCLIMSETSESQCLSVIRVWAAMAWADDVIAEPERVAMTKLIAAAQLSDDERGTANSFLETKIELDVQSMSGLSSKAREGIYRAALRLAMVDMDMAPEEVAMLQRIRHGLNLDEATCEQIEKSISPS